MHRYFLMFAIALGMLGLLATGVFSDEDDAPIRIYQIIEVDGFGNETYIGDLNIDLGNKTATWEFNGTVICGPSDYSRSGWLGAFDCVAGTFFVEDPDCSGSFV